MNAFNWFQALAVYTLLPYLIIWLHQHEYTLWMYPFVGIQLIGYFALSLFITTKRNF